MTDRIDEWLAQKGFMKDFPENMWTAKDLFVALRIALSLLALQITYVKPHFMNPFNYR